MLKIGLTGNIASGKSTVEAILKGKGYKVIDADAIAHDLLKEHTVKNQIIESFSNYDIIENDEISRPKLGKIVFTNDDERKKLELIIHPLIRTHIKNHFKQNEKDEKIIFVSIPLLFEAKFEDMFDKIILVYADDKIRKERLIKRNDLTAEMALNRIAIQMSQDKKKPMSAFVIFNNGTFEELQMQVDSLEYNLV